MELLSTLIALLGLAVLVAALIRPLRPLDHAGFRPDGDYHRDDNGVVP